MAVGNVSISKVVMSKAFESIQRVVVLLTTLTKT